MKHKKQTGKQGKVGKLVKDTKLSKTANAPA